MFCECPRVSFANQQVGKVPYLRQLRFPFIMTCRGMLQCPQRERLLLRAAACNWCRARNSDAFLIMLSSWRGLKNEQRAREQSCAYHRHKDRPTT